MRRLVFCEASDNRQWITSFFRTVVGRLRPKPLPNQSDSSSAQTTNEVSSVHTLLSGISEVIKSIEQTSSSREIKRTAWTVTRSYLKRKGINLDPPQDDETVERIVRRAGLFETDELAEWLETGEIDESKLPEH
jgi:hypothetical protein